MRFRYVRIRAEAPRTPPREGGDHEKTQCSRRGFGCARDHRIADARRRRSRRRLAARQPRQRAQPARAAAPPKAGGVHPDQGLFAIRDKAGRVLVDVYARPGESLGTVRQRAEAGGLEAKPQSADQQALEGFIALNQVKTLATTDGIASVAQAPKAFTKVGAATSQGVHAQRVDRVPRGVDGNGITVGALSDSFDEATTDVNGNPLTIHAAQDVASGDLPKDVKVVEDSTQG